MADIFLTLLIGIITIVLSCLLFALMSISSMCDEEKELWERKKRKK